LLRAMPAQSDLRGMRQGATDTARAGRRVTSVQATAQTESVYRTAATGFSAEAPALRGRRSDMEILPLFDGAYTIVQGRQPDLPVTEEDRLTWVPYFCTSIKASAQENFVASVFYPADLKAKDGGVQFKLEPTGKPRGVSYTLQGKTVKYVLDGEKVTRTAE
jgi:hypothetical protein